MREPLNTIPYNFRRATEYPSVPEFYDGSGIQKKFVGETQVSVTDSYHVLVSESLNECSGLFIADPTTTKFGLVHAAPDQTLRQKDFDRLAMVEGGQLILLQGSESSYPDTIIEDLASQLGIRHIDTISIPTRGGPNPGRNFHIALRTRENAILVARDSYLDLSFYRGF